MHSDQLILEYLQMIADKLDLLTTVLSARGVITLEAMHEAREKLLRRRALEAEMATLIQREAELDPMTLAKDHRISLSGSPE